MKKKTTDKILKMSQFEKRPNSYIRGSRDWAEWCERFEKVLDDAVNDTIGPVSNNAKSWMDNLLYDYRQWLEDK